MKKLLPLLFLTSLGFSQPCCLSDCEITPPAGPCVSCGVDVFLTGEFIYWIVYQENMTFAKLEDSTGTGEKGGVADPDFHFEPGFKVGLGYLSDCDGWDLYLNYTWLRTRNTENSLKPSGNRVVEDYLWATNANFGNRNSLTVNRETFNWEQDFNVWDLELGRNFFISPCLKLRPYLGFKGTWQDQKAVAVADEVNDSGDFFTTEGRHTNDFWGFGIRIGMDTSWQFTPCVSLFGDFAASSLFGRFDTTSKIVQTANATGAFTTPINQEVDFYTTRPVLEWSIGLRYDWWFCCDTYHVGIDVAWEHQWWAQMNEFYAISFNAAERGGEMTMHGITVKLRFDF